MATDAPGARSVRESIKKAREKGTALVDGFVWRWTYAQRDTYERILGGEIGDIRTIYDNYGFETQILAASIRSANHMKDAALIGADVATAPPAVIKAMASHVLTDKGLDGFLADAKKAGIKIL